MAFLLDWPLPTQSGENTDVIALPQLCTQDPDEPEFRSFGPTTQYIAPLKKISILAGANNSGKSNILSFAKLLSEALAEKRLHGHIPKRKGTLDIPIGSSGNDIQFSYFIEYNDEFKEYLFGSRQEFYVNQARIRSEELFNSKIFNHGNNLICLDVKFTNSISTDEEIIRECISSSILLPNDWKLMWEKISKRQGGTREHWIRESLAIIAERYIKIPPVEIIPAIRRIGEAQNGDEFDFSGNGIIENLAKLQNPDHTERNELDKFVAINQFLKEITGNDSAKIEIPYSRDKILVHMDGKVLPLTSLGTGIHEVIILASAATLISNRLVCIEEPELHLHPALQRKLVKYLSIKTNNQYLITTHSAHFLDTNDASVFSVSLDNNQTKVSLAVEASQISSICRNLGYRASDIMQCNCIVWVEGPSDRIYLNNWIREIDSNLIEGLHYSIMFYGGRLLSHLSADDAEVEEFISLRRLNRNICIIIDSDRKNARTDINSTKARVASEFDKGSGFAWITAGKEIENYIKPETMEKAISELDGSFDRLKGKKMYDRLYDYYNAAGGKVLSPDKVKLARKVTELTNEMDVYDLSVMVKKLVGFIVSCNDS